MSEGGERASSGVALAVESNDVSVDLQAHTLDADGLGASGVSGGLKNIAIQNGTIKSRTGWGVQFGDLFGHYFGSIVSDFTPTFGQDGDASDRTILRREVLTPLARLRGNFTATRHVLSNLTIEVGSSDTHAKRQVWQNGVAIKGAGNTVRGNTIKVIEGHAGVYLFGPDQIIENNTIIFKGHSAVPSGAPIKLHLADNSIIRNNTIVIEGWGDKPDAAISIIDSKNVVIENNKIIGVKQLYKIWDEEPDQKSSVVERGNEFASGWSRLFGK